MNIAPCGVGLASKPMILVPTYFSRGPTTTVIGGAPRYALPVTPDPEPNSGQYSVAMEGYINYVMPGSPGEPEVPSFTLQVAAWALIGGTWAAWDAASFFRTGPSATGGGNAVLNFSVSFTASIPPGATQIGIYHGSLTASTSVNDFALSRFVSLDWVHQAYP